MPWVILLKSVGGGFGVVGVSGVEVETRWQLPPDFVPLRAPTRAEAERIAKALDHVYLYRTHTVAEANEQEELLIMQDMMAG